MKLEIKKNVFVLLYKKFVNKVIARVNYYEEIKQTSDFDLCTVFFYFLQLHLT